MLSQARAKRQSQFVLHVANNTIHKGGWDGDQNPPEHEIRKRPRVALHNVLYNHAVQLRDINAQERAANLNTPTSERGWRLRTMKKGER